MAKKSFNLLSKKSGPLLSEEKKFMNTSYDKMSQHSDEWKFDDLNAGYETHSSKSPESNRRSSVA